MAEKVPSFKTGGTLWFTDLTTADTTYILPLLTAVTLLIMVESNMQEGLEGNPVAGTMKKFSRIIAFLSIPVLIGIEKALFYYWLTSNLFALGYGLAIRCPDGRKLLNLPDVVISSSTGQPSPHSPMPFSFPQRKDQSIIQEDPPLSSESSSGVPDGRISRSSVLNQRIRTLERQLKDRKKKKFQEVIVLDPDLSRDYLDLIQDRTKEKKYCFDHAFGPESTYKNVYRSMSSVFSAGVVHGLNAICMSFYWKWQNIYNG